MKIEKGYIIKVESWENDYDNVRQKEINLEKVEV